MVIQYTTRDQTGFWLKLKGPGSQLPLLKSAMGIAFLAHAERNLRGPLLRSALSLDGKLTPRLQQEPRWVAQLLSATRERGIASLRDSWYSEAVPLSAIAVPIFRGRNACAALGLTYYQSAMFGSDAIQQFGGALKDVAVRIGAQL
jgi:DNA-binding IclR family transcriptional regulator